ncbi:protein-glutamate methylesterase/protein-glutamine glutaminase [Rubrivivax albus]|uniref:Protein-glutamate methylesterase/protein-glutamine glutaminase n=1 Tax=Rubrivivax albus TaxID=2499835 RepID=A0A3S2TJ23_9BURK|nr:chemotaxis response regulator protein-glutamate methylesterase [Rubrivivax albus]RVT48360.1 chemotaxis response regulator protein-glutamate methylesterase [Rubrivivax albus]
MTATRITAAVVDDSAVVRKHLSDLLTTAGIDVLFTAGDPLFAWPKLQARWPDVIVLDVEMPRMDGISFLRQIMGTRPTPVVMCSTLTAAGAATTLQALAEGAVAFVTKPTIGLRDFLGDPGNGLVAAVRAAASARMSAVRRPAAAMPTANTPVAAPPLAPAAHAPVLGQTTERIIAIGASTGGVQAIERVLTALPRTAPGTLIVQHMPAQFTAAFADRLNALCAMEVREAADGDRVMPGRVLIAPGGQHMQLRRNGAQYTVSVRDGPLVNRHRPSVDVLFRSVAQQAGRNAAGALLTGMGDDGARGLLEMRQAGAATAAQDESTCVVFGMPKAALQLGAAAATLPLDQMGQWLVGAVTPAEEARN